MRRKRKIKIITCEYCGKEFHTFRNVKYCSRICAGLASKSLTDTICWHCARATGFCSWSEKFIPVRGWKATPTEVKIASRPNGTELTTDSFIVHECPLFERG